VQNTSLVALRSHDIPEKSESELRCCAASRILLTAYRWSIRLGLHKLMQSILRITLKLEGGEFYSSTARRLMREYHQIEIGAYSYGCFDYIRFPDGAYIGRYVSIARSVRSYRRNHPTDRLSTHPFLFNEKYSSLQSSNMPAKSLVIDHDAWIGAHAVILPGCQHIGVGAIVGAGSVVTRDVEPYAIVAGNPARLVRNRFESDKAKRILKSRWWEISQNALQNKIADYEQNLLLD
jgi:virginiamycin A acetyltransferase